MHAARTPSVVPETGFIWGRRFNQLKWGQTIMNSELLKLVSLEARVACVTGGGRGIGRAIAVRLAQAGAKVVMTDVLEADLNEALGLVTAAGSKGHIIVSDAGKMGEGERVVAETVKTFGRLDIFVNNAAVFW